MKNDRDDLINKTNQLGDYKRQLRLLEKTRSQIDDEMAEIKGYIKEIEDSFPPEFKEFIAQADNKQPE